MALAAVNVTIVIDDVPYSIVEIPPQTSRIVIKQKEGLLQQVDLKVHLIYNTCYYIRFNENDISDYTLHGTASNTAETSAEL